MTSFTDHDNVDDPHDLGKLVRSYSGLIQEVTEWFQQVATDSMEQVMAQGISGGKWWFKELLLEEVIIVSHTQH